MRRGGGGPGRQLRSWREVLQQEADRDAVRRGDERRLRSGMKRHGKRLAPATRLCMANRQTPGLMPATGCRDSSQ